MIQNRDVRSIEDLDQDKLRDASKFMLKLAVAGFIFRGVLYLSPETFFLESILAGITGNIIQLFEGGTRVLGNRILIGDHIFVVTQDCLGWKSIAAFSGLCWASDIIDRGSILIKGFAVISIANVARIVSTVLMANYEVISFELVHGLLWRWGLTFVVISMWAYWFRKTKK